ncbi:hypothetical protein TNCV_1258911 [Trichonephila clavipes]|nr:hypothetical protein TNCV_1258911 [Trichonephila clavipes]
MVRDVTLWTITAMGTICLSLQPVEQRGDCDRPRRSVRVYFEETQRNPFPYKLSNTFPTADSEEHKRL